MGRVLRVLVVMLLVAMLPNAAMAQTAGLRDQLADTRSERERTEEQLEEVVTVESEARDRLATIDRELDTAEHQLADLEVELVAAEAELARTSRKAQTARERLAAVRAELAEAESELDEKHARLEERLRAAFKYGQVSFVQAFAGVRDMADFLNSTTYIGHVLEGDRELVEEVGLLVGAVEQQRAEAQVVRVDAEREAAATRAATAELEAATVEQQRLAELVRQRKADQQVALEELGEDRSAIEGHLAGLEAESARIEAELAEIARQQAAAAARAAAAERVGTPGFGSGIQGVSSSGWVRPTAGAPTSPFGPRWGRSHNGVDLGGGVGAAVVAARSGTVVHVTSTCHPTSSWGCGGGFGNYVTVAHADGTATIYAHLSAIGVGVGQQVGAGAPIGAVGNSGNSYGPHLHFEVRQAGGPRDPCQYIPC